MRNPTATVSLTIKLSSEQIHSIAQAVDGVERFTAQLRKDLTPDKFKRHSDYSKATAALDGIDLSLQHGFGEP